MAPTLTDGDGWLAMLRTAIGRDRKSTVVELSWPDQMESATCPLRTADRLREPIAAKCKAKPRTGPDWPCLPGSGAKAETVRAPSGYGSLLWSGGWRVKGSDHHKPYHKSAPATGLKIDCRLQSLRVKTRNLEMTSAH